MLKPSTPVVFILGAKTPSLRDCLPNTSSAPASGSRRRTRGEPALLAGLFITGTFLTVALVTTLHRAVGQKHCATSIPPTSPPQPNNPPRAFVGREERDPGRGLSVVTSSEPYPNLHVDDIADGVFITAGYLEARSINIQDG